jgi:prepilin-type N-terminal cleavage/methylation domain-containing protein
MTKPILTSRPSARPSAPLEAASHRLAQEAGGFTLIELMVSISIMAIIALAFGGLLTQANQVVTEGEKRMRADAAASAISRIIRGDIRKITKNGFFRINNNKLVLVTAGRMQSSFSSHSGDGAVIVYGRHNASNVLYRKVLVLARSANNIVDCLKWKTAGMSLAQLQVMSAGDMTTLINEVAKDPPGMAYPPETLNQITGPTSTMWMILAGNCTELSITYRPSDEEDSWPDDTTCTRHNQTNWPKAIKFNFKLKPGTLMSAAIADDERDNVDVNYEILCPVGH